MAIKERNDIDDSFRKGKWSTCEWEYNDEHERWDTECDDVIALHAGESPFEYGFKFCPFCGKEVREM